MMGPSSSYTAGAVKIGNAAYAVLGGMQPDKLTIHYYESFAQNTRTRYRFSYRWWCNGL